MAEVKTIEEAQKQLKDIGASFNRLITQIEGSCIADDIKTRMLEDLKEMAFEVHHLTAFCTSQDESTGAS